MDTCGATDKLTAEKLAGLAGLTTGYRNSHDRLENIGRTPNYI